MHNDEAERTAIAVTARQPEVEVEVLGGGRANGRYGRSLQRLVSRLLLIGGAAK